MPWTRREKCSSKWRNGQMFQIIVIVDKWNMRWLLRWEKKTFTYRKWTSCMTSKLTSSIPHLSLMWHLLSPQLIQCWTVKAFVSVMKGLKSKISIRTRNHQRTHIMITITFFICWWTYNSGLLNGHVSSQWLIKSTVDIWKGVPKGVPDAMKSTKIFVGSLAAL